MPEKLFQVVARVMEVPVESVSMDSGPLSIANWESLRHMRLLLALEEQYGIVFGEDELSSMQDLRSIAATLRRHGVPL